jgi:hypothetical protein
MHTYNFFDFLLEVWELILFKHFTNLVKFKLFLNNFY